MKPIKFWVLIIKKKKMRIVNVNVVVALMIMIMLACPSIILVGAARDFQNPYLRLQRAYPFLRGPRRIILPGSELAKCWSPLDYNLHEVEYSCADEIRRSALKEEFHIDVEACCPVIFEVNDECWSLMYSRFPGFPDLLKDYCLRNGVGPVLPIS